MATTLNALWPTITTRRAAVSAALISATTTLSAAFVYFLLERNTIAEHGTLALLFPALLMVIAWRTWRLSRGWSLCGAILAGLMVAASLLTGPDLRHPCVFCHGHWIPRRTCVARSLGWDGESRRCLGRRIPREEHMRITATCPNGHRSTTEYTLDDLRAGKEPESLLRLYCSAASTAPITYRDQASSR